MSCSFHLAKEQQDENSEAIKRGHTVDFSNTLPEKMREKRTKKQGIEREKEKERRKRKATTTTEGQRKWRLKMQEQEEEF